MNATATGSMMMPYISDPGFSSSAKAKIAIEAPAKMMEMCIQAKNVRSFAKNTLGSTLMGAFRCFKGAWFAADTASV